jgi:hypothetical protein
MTHRPKAAPIGVDNFAELIDKEKNYLFVDKTLMIKELIDNQEKVALILRPRRWGKSMNMSMLKCFFAAEVMGKPTAGIFDDLKIAKENDGEYIRKYQGKHPVIIISFKDVKELDFTTTIGKIGILIYNAIAEFAHLPSFFDNFKNLEEIYDNLLHKKATNEDLQESFKLLSEALYKYYDQKVIIFIDEYDAPLNASYSNPELFKQVVSFFRGFFGAALKGNHALEKGVMTGILRLSKNNMLSDLNNIKLYSMANDEYSDSFGFFEDDVVELFKQADVACNLPAIKSWYNGYKCGNKDGIYNPWSILNCISKKGVLGPYWVKTGNDDLLRDIFVNAHPDIKEKVKTLIAGGSVQTIIDDFISFDQIQYGNEELIWSALWALGYLKIVGETPMRYDTMYDLAIPNDEIDYTYSKMFIGLFRNMQGADGYYRAIRALADGDVEKFSEALTEFMLTSPSYHDLPHESHYHLLVLGMLSALKENYIILSNRESGLGRFDIAMVPYDDRKDLGIIIEFKKEKIGETPEFYQQRAKEALAQIVEKKYGEGLKGHKNVKRVLNLAMVFYGKEFVCDYAFLK